MPFYNAHEEYRFYQRKQKKYEVMPKPKGTQKENNHDRIKNYGINQHSKENH